MNDVSVPTDPGRAVPLAPHVARVLAPNPGPMTGPGTNTYLVGDDAALLILDPGPDDAGHGDALVSAVGDRRVVAVLATHHHGDHWPLARRLCAHFGVPLLAHGRDGVLEPDLRVGDGHRVDAGGVTLTAVHTPGHASDHLCWLLDGSRALFTGDHVMSGSTVVIAPPDGDMATYMDSLQRTRELAPSVLYPAHGGVITDADGVHSWYLAHRREREAQVLGAVADGVDTVSGIVAAVYTDVAPALHPVARYSVLAHLEKLAREGGVEAATGTGGEPPRQGPAADNPELPPSEPSGMRASWRLGRPR